MAKQQNRRLEIQKGLHQVYLPYYISLCNLLPDCWQPISGLRTFEEQERLYAQGRTQAGQIVTYAQPGLSLHNYGLATDWAYFDKGRYVPLHYRDGKWLEYIHACQKCGVGILSDPGLRLLSFEVCHNEYPLKLKVRLLLDAYKNGGYAEVDRLLRR